MSFQLQNQIADNFPLSTAGHEDDYVIELANEVRKVLESLKQKAPVMHLHLQSHAPFLHIKTLPETTVAVDSWP